MLDYGQSVHVSFAPRWIRLPESVDAPLTRRRHPLTLMPDVASCHLECSVGGASLTLTRGVVTTILCWMLVQSHCRQTMVVSGASQRDSILLRFGCFCQLLLAVSTVLLCIRILYANNRTIQCVTVCYVWSLKYQQSSSLPADRSTMPEGGCSFHVIV